MTEPRPELATFAEALTVAMARNRMKVQELADAVGVSRASVSAWRSGTAAPDLDRLPAIAEAVGVPHSELLTALGSRGTEVAAGTGRPDVPADEIADLRQEVREVRDLLEQLLRDREG